MKKIICGIVLLAGFILCANKVHAAVHAIVTSCGTQFFEFEGEMTDKELLRIYDRLEARC